MTSFIDAEPAGHGSQLAGKPLAPIDLLFTAGAIVERLRTAVRDRQWLDAYLLAAGLNQMVEDRLHPDPLQLHRVASYLHGLGSRSARFGGGMVSAAARLLRPFAVGPSAQLWRERELLTEATIHLAGAVLDPESVDPAMPVGLHTLEATVRALGAKIVRVPACFHSFDQHPDDVSRLVRGYVRSYDVSARVCVVGVRTSGSYLAPLCAAALRAAGVTSVVVVTCRPGRPWRRREAMTVRDVVAAGGRVLLTDDPPVSGTAVASVAQAIGGLGVSKDTIVLLLALAGTDVPEALTRWSGVYLRWDEWSVHDRLTEAAVGEALAGLLGPGHRVVACRRPWRSSRGDQRGCAHARFSVQVTGDGGFTRRCEIAVEGAGLGYLGRHAIAVASALPGHCPHVYGLADGLLYREWIPGTPNAPDDRELAAAVTGYVVDRGRALRVSADPTSRLRGRGPVWEVAAGLLSRLFGRLAPVGQLVLLDRVVRRLLRVENPSVPDGQTHVRYWLATRPGSPLRKVNFHRGLFSNPDSDCYDAVFDLAGAAADPPSDDFEGVLRATYQHHTGHTIDPERWLLYRLTQLRRLDRAGEMERHQAADRSADTVHDYLCTIFATGALEEDGGDNGQICAIDLDGVLETDPLGFPCVTPSGALTLRALSAHGFRPVLATGRSLPDTVARCRRFGLAGAVAEYGAVLYDHSTGHRTDMRVGAARATMERLRRALARHRDIEVDERHRYIVRTRSGSGPIAEDLAREIGSSVGGLLRIVHGDGQTDFVPVGVDKGTGLRALAAQLRGRVVLAVGDSTEDLPMFGQAAIARAPRNANRELRSAGIRIMRGAYQAGLADACSELLGHPPGGCPRCRPQEIPERTAVMCAMLGLREDGLRGLPSRTARLAALVARTSRW